MITVKLTPQSYGDRNYVAACEQNPYLNVQMNINDKMSSLFTLLRRKWTLPSYKMVPIDIPIKAATSTNCVFRPTVFATRLRRTM